MRHDSIRGPARLADGPRKTGGGGATAVGVCNLYGHCVITELTIPILTRSYRNKNSVHYAPPPKKKQPKTKQQNKNPPKSLRNVPDDTKLIARNQRVMTSLFDKSSYYGR